MADRFDCSEYAFKLRDRQWNRKMQSGYVAHFRGCHKVLDLACGSGIFLELLAEQGIPALGVERNPAIVAWVKQHGWDIVEQDVFAFLEQTTETYDGVFCSHFLEHLPLEQVLRFFELLAPCVRAAGTVVIVVPNHESIRMQLLGFWRDPEYGRFYHPELLEALCRHAGLEVTHTNREDVPHLLPPLVLPRAVEAGRGQPPRPRGWLKERLRAVYFQLLRRLRLTPAADLLAVEARLRQHMEAQQKAMTVWAEGANEAINSIWVRPDNAAIVCRKTKA